MKINNWSVKSQLKIIGFMDNTDMPSPSSSRRDRNSPATSRYDSFKFIFHLLFLDLYLLYFIISVSDLVTRCRCSLPSHLVLPCQEWTVFRLRSVDHQDRKCCSALVFTISPEQSLMRWGRWWLPGWRVRISMVVQSCSATLLASLDSCPPVHTLQLCSQEPGRNSQS